MQYYLEPDTGRCKSKMKKRSGRPDKEGLSEDEDAQGVPDSLYILSESEPASENEESDLPDETDSEAGLPSDDLHTDAQESSSDASSEKDELDQAFWNALENDGGSKAGPSSQPPAR